MRTFYLPLALFFLCIGLYAQAPFPFEDDFEDGTLNLNYWTKSTNIFGTDGVIEVDDGIGTNSSYGVKIGKLNDNTGFTTNGLDLHINLSGQTDVELSFWIADSYDETDSFDGIYFSDDNGSNFVKILDFYPDEWCNNLYGQHPPIDVDQLAAAAGLSMTAQFVIRFQQRGEDDFSGNSATSEDGFFLDDVRVYDPQIVYHDLSSGDFYDSFDNGVFNQSWAWNFADETVSINSNSQPTSPMSLVEVKSGVGINNSYGVQMGRRCDNTFSTNALDLHLNLLNQTDVELSFWIADSYDETDNDDGIYFSDDGGQNFSKVLGLYPDEWCNNLYGQHPPIDVDQLAAAAGLSMTAQFVIRFQQRGEDDFSGNSATSEDGFFLDDVRVYDPQIVYHDLSSGDFYDSFDNGVFNQSWAWSFADETASINSNSQPTSPMGLVDIKSGVGINNSYGVQMGRRCDNTFSTNALDLHLNLLNQTDVELSFWIADSYDETDNDDGIYFSDDGGQNFSKVLSLYPDEWCNNLYGQYPPIDVDKLAAAAGLSMSSQFIIRFQQRGEDDFSGNSATSEDGFFLDDVRVYDPEVVYHNIAMENFEDSFEVGIFNQSWAWNFADETVSINSNSQPTSPMGVIEIKSGVGINNSYGLQMGRRCDNTFSTNALDLHLNLQFQTDVELSFWIADSFDETDNDDGIYFSDDAGSNFTKVYDFDFSSTDNNIYQEYQLSISDLINSNDLSFSNQFIIRFQQRGEDDFSGNSATSEDGLFLDDVVVSGLITQTQKIGIENSIKVSPIPSSDVLTISLETPNSSKIQTISIFDILGQKQVHYQGNQANQQTIDISNLPNGTYLLSIELENGEQGTKLIIKN